MRFSALLCLLLGALAACGFAPLQLWPLTIACVAMWLALVNAAPTVRIALWRGWLFGVGHFTVNNNWFQHAFDFQDKMPPALGYGAAVGLALYLAVYPMAAAGVAWRFRNERGADMPFVLAFAAAWIATEWLRATIFTGYAWDPLGAIWVPVRPIAALAAWVGTYALSGLTILAAGAAAIHVRQGRRELVGGLALLLVALQVSSYHAPAADRSPADAPRIRVVQPNIGQQDRNDDDGPRVFAALSRLSGKPGPAPRLVVWPEGMLRAYVEDGYPAVAYGYVHSSARAMRERIAGLLGPRDVLMTGGDSLRFDARDQLAGAGNSVFAIDATARLIGRYDKAHLVPYGEYLPMPWLLNPLGLARLVPGDIDFDPGPGPRNLTFPGVGAIGVQVCYEIIFSGEVVDRAHRPALLLNPSNDAWFGRWGSPQFLAQARMRAIEEGLPIVRATPTGISAIIAADGRLVATAPPGKAAAIEAPIPAARPPTLFSRVGNGLAALIGLALFATGVAMRWRRR